MGHISGRAKLKRHISLHEATSYDPSYKTLKLWDLAFRLLSPYPKSWSSGVTCLAHSTSQFQKWYAQEPSSQARMPTWLSLSSPSKAEGPFAGLGERGGQGGSHDSFGILRGWCAASPCRQGVNESSDMSYWSTYVPRFSKTLGKGQTV